MKQEKLNGGTETERSGRNRLQTKTMFCIENPQRTKKGRIVVRKGRNIGKRIIFEGGTYLRETREICLQSIPYQ